MKRRKLTLLLTNDDGVRAEGLLALRSEMAGLGRPIVVAPDEERSGVSHGLTIHHPIRVSKIDADRYSLTGTPADCVLFAIQKLGCTPDLVISGINHGPNLGDDILYSGTVAAAREGSLYGVPSVAVSLVVAELGSDFGPAARFVRELIHEFYPDRFSDGCFLNINVPPGNPQTYRFTRQGSKLPAGSVEEKQDPRGRKYYWIGRDESRWVLGAGTDYRAVREGFISITPLQRDQTDYRTLKWYAGQTDPTPSAG